jgi:2-oxoglutarate dehydrogenase E2 component (dihydrolipoamide succinyltransferase)
MTETLSLSASQAVTGEVQMPLVMGAGPQATPPPPGDASRSAEDNPAAEPTSLAAQAGPADAEAPPPAAKAPAPAAEAPSAPGGPTAWLIVEGALVLAALGAGLAAWLIYRRSHP